MTVLQYDISLLTIALLSSLVCALPGCFLVLRKMSLLGDAISHAVLPGIAIAYAVTQTRQGSLFFIGAVVCALIVALGSKFVRARTGANEHALLGTMFSLLFAIGLILINSAAARVDLDPSCVLYGVLELAPLDTVSVFGYIVPRSLTRLVAVLVLNGAVMALCYKELNITSFDPSFARNTGISYNAVQYLFIGMIAVTTVTVFELVGSILVIVMLVAPGATAFIICRRLRTMLVLAALFAIGATLGGYALAVLIPPAFGIADTSIAGSIAVVCGIGYVLVLLLHHSVRRGRAQQAVAPID